MLSLKEKRTKYFRSLTVSLSIAFLVLSAIVLLTANSLNTYFNFQNLQKLIISHQHLIAQNAANTVKNFVQEKFGILEKAVALGGLATVGQKEQEQVLKILLGKETYFRQLILANTQEQEIIRVSRISKLLSVRLMEYNKEEVFSSVRQKKIYISPIYIDKMTNEPMLILAVPVNDVFDDFKGILMAEVNLKFMWDFIDSIKIGDNGLVYVVDNKGDLIAFRDISRVLKGENLTYLEEVNKFIKGDKPSYKTRTGIVKGIQGTMVVSNHANLITPDWAVVVELPVTEAYKSVIEGVKLSAGSALLSFILAILLGIYLSKRITKPIINLRDATMRVSNGDLSSAIKIESKNEIGDLADSFNQMVVNLNKTTVSIEELKNEQKRFLDVAESSGDWIWELDTQGKYTYSNAMVQNILGYSAEEILGRYYFDFFPPDEQDRLKQGANEVFSQKESFRNFSNQNIHKQGHIVTLETSGVPIISDDGKILGYRGVNRDITYRKKAEQEKEKLQSQLMQSEKMSAIGQLAGGVAHEINNPMGTILGFAQGIVKKIKEDDPLYLPLKSIERESIRCKKLIEDLLTFSRIGKTLSETIDINKTTDETLSLIEAQAKLKNIEIIRDYSNELTQITANKNQIQQVIINLCNNAIDACQDRPEGNKIIIRTAFTPPGEEKRIEISISDTGTGITEEVKKHLFEPFYTTKEVGKGTGLGLSLVHEIIRKHQGIIKVESEAGKGSVFSIKLPLA